MILWEMEKCRKYEDYIKLLDIYGNYLTTVNHQQRLDAVSAKLYKGAAGKLASMHQKRTKQLQTMKTTANNNTEVCYSTIFVPSLLNIDPNIFYSKMCKTSRITTTVIHGK